MATSISLTFIQTKAFAVSTHCAVGGEGEAS